MNLLLPILITSLAAMHFVVTMRATKKIMSLWQISGAEYNSLRSSDSITNTSTQSHMQTVDLRQYYNFTKPKPMPTEPRIYFVHIGKAGGVSLYDTLRIRTGRKRLAPACRKEGLVLPWGNENSCYRSFPTEQVLARHIVGHTHLHSKMYSTIEKEWMLDNSNMFLYTVRDPIDRIISAYNYHRAESRNRETHHRFYQTCFPDGLDTLISVLHCKGNTESLMKCRDLGLNTLQGNIPDVGRYQSGQHFFFNYRHYIRKTLDVRPEHAVAVIRTEYMWHDVIELDLALGGSGKFSNAGFIKTHGSENWKYDTNITSSNTQYLCCLIYDELAAYQDLVLRAFNLNDTEKGDAINRIISRCQIDISGYTPEHQFSWSKFNNETCPSILEC